MSKVSILSLEWDHQTVAIFKCFRTDEKCVADELKVAAGAEIKSDPDMHRVINALQRDLVHKRIYYYAKNPTTHLLTFREPRDGEENAGQQHLSALLQAQTTEQVRDQARALASRYTEIPGVREGVLIFLISRGTLGESVAENCAFIFKCDFEQVSQITSHQLFRQVQDAIVERTKKGALYPYFQQNEFDKTTVRVFDELGQTQYWLEFLGLGERAPAHESLQEAVVGQLPYETVAKYEGQFARLPTVRPLADDRGRLISRADRLSTAKVQALSDEAIGEAGRQTVSLHLDEVRLTAPLNQYGRTWIIAEEAGERYIIVKGSQLESHTKMLTPIDLADFPSLREAATELGISLP